MVAREVSEAGDVAAFFTAAGCSVGIIDFGDSKKLVCISDGIAARVLRTIPKSYEMGNIEGFRTLWAHGMSVTEIIAALRDE